MNYLMKFFLEILEIIKQTYKQTQSGTKIRNVLEEQETNQQDFYASTVFLEMLFIFDGLM